MPATRPQQISHQEWEDQKSVIERLFLRDRRSLRDEHDKEGIISYMSRERNFTATLSQYEARLKNWKFRKNINTKDWVEIAKLIAGRKEEGKLSAVFVSGVPLEDSQVSKGILRRAVRDASRKKMQENQPIHQLPLYVEIRTPQLGPQSDDHQLQPESYDVETSRSRYSDILTQGADTTVDNSISPLLDLDHNLNDAHETLNTLFGVVPDSGTKLVRCSSFSSGLFPLDARRPWICASPIYPGGPADFIRDTVRGKLNSHIRDSISMISRIEKDADLRIDPEISISERCQKSIMNILPMRYDYNFGNMTQSSCILQLAIHEIVNGDYRPRAFGTFRDYTQYKMYEVRLEYSKPVLWALSYFQQGSLRFLEKLRKSLPAPYLETIFRNLFTLALETHAYKMLEWLLLHSDTISKTSDTRIRSYTQHLSCVMGDGPASLTLSILAQFGERAIDWDFLSRTLHEDPVQKLSDVVSRGIRPDWETLLPQMTRLRDTSEFHEVIDKFLIGASEPRWDLVPTLIVSIIRNMSEKDALREVRAILMVAQPATINNLIRISQIPWTGDLGEKEKDMLAAAVARQFDNLIDLLISTGFQGTSSCLFEALRVERMDLVELLLQHGASPWIQAHTKTLEDDDSLFNSSDEPKLGDYTTPYAEAIRMKMNGALRLFDHTPFEFPNGSKIDHVMFSVIVAASESGYEEILHQFLQPRLMNPSYMSELDDWFPSLTEAVDRATKNGHMSIVALLLQVGVPPSVEVFDHAVRSQDIAMITQLFDNNTEFEKLYYYSYRLEPSREDIGYHVIMTAIACGNKGTLSTVLNCVDLNKVKRPGDILRAGVLQDNPAMVRDLLQRGIDPNSSLSIELDQELLETPLVTAIRRGNKRIIAMLLDHHAWLNPSISGYTKTKSWTRCTSALEAAAEILDAELIKELLHRGAEPCDSSAILILAEAESWESLEQIDCKAEGQNPAVKTELLCHALVAAVEFQSFDLLQRLLPHINQDFLFDTDLNEITRNCTPHRRRQSRITGYKRSRLSILGFTMNRHVQKKCPPEIVRILLEFENSIERICYKSSEFNEREYVTYCYSPLQNAVLLRSKKWVDVLMDFGADINRGATNFTGCTALQLAVDIGDVEMVSYLLSKGALVDAPPAPHQGLTALQLAAKHGFYRIAEILIDAKADVDAPRAKVGGRTAFEAATENGRLDMMGLLVKNGALSIDMELQYERAVKFAKAQGQDPAAEYAGQLRDKILEARRAAEEEYRELLDVPLIGFDT